MHNKLYNYLYHPISSPYVKIMCYVESKLSSAVVVSVLQVEANPNYHHRPNYLDSSMQLSGTSIF